MNRALIVGIAAVTLGMASVKVQPKLVSFFALSAGAASLGAAVESGRSERRKWARLCKGLETEREAIAVERRKIQSEATAEHKRVLLECQERMGRIEAEYEVKNRELDEYSHKVGREHREQMEKAEERALELRDRALRLEESERTLKDRAEAASRAWVEEEGSKIVHERNLVLQDRQTVREQELRLDAATQKLHEERLEAQRQLNSWRADVEAQVNEFRMEKEQNLRQYFESQQSALAKREQDISCRVELTVQEWKEKFEAVYDGAKQFEIEANQQINQAREYAESAEARAESKWKSVYYSFMKTVMVENATLKRPDYLRAVTVDEFQANDVIECLKNNGIICKDSRVKSLPKGWELSFKPLPIVVSPHRGNEEKDLERLTVGEAIAKVSNSKVLVDIMASVTGCQQLPKVTADFERIKLTVDTSGEQFKELPPKDPMHLEQPPSDHLVDFVSRSPQLGIFGNTGSGKSVMLNNIIKLIQHLEGDIELIVADPKPSDEYKDLEPQYLGRHEGMLCLQSAYNLVKERGQLWLQDRKNGLPSRKFHSILYLIDEINLLLGQWNSPTSEEDIEWLLSHDMPKKNGVSNMLKEIWRAGRELGVKVLVCGQNLQAGNFNVNLADFDNLGMIYLGNSIKSFLRSHLILDEKKQIESELLIYRRKYVLDLKKHPEQKYPATRFFGLYCGAGETPYMAYSMSPGGWNSVVNSINVPLDRANGTFDGTNGTFDGIFGMKNQGKNETQQGLHHSNVPSNVPLPPPMEQIPSNVPFVPSTSNYENETDKGFQNLKFHSDVEISRLNGFKKPKKPCLISGEIGEIERDWVKWLWYVKNERLKRNVLGEVWGIKSWKGRDYDAANNRLKQINQEENLGFKWRD